MSMCYAFIWSHTFHLKVVCQEVIYKQAKYCNSNTFGIYCNTKRRSQSKRPKKVIVFAMIEINLKCHSFVYRLLHVKSLVLSAGVLRWDAIKICHHNKEFMKQKKNIFGQTDNRFEFWSGNMMCCCWFCCCWR